MEGQSSPVPRIKETFTAIPRQWCMIDIDSLAWDGDISDQQAWPVEKGCCDNSPPLKILTIVRPVADANGVTNSFICIPFQNWTENISMEVEKYQSVMIFERDRTIGWNSNGRTYNRSSVTAWHCGT